MLETGRVLNEKYKIIKEIGHGGMSVVYLAVDEQTKEYFAVKEVLGSKVKDFSVVCRNLKGTIGILRSITDSPKSITDSPKSITDSPESIADSSESIEGSPESIVDRLESIAGRSEGITDSTRSITAKSERKTSSHLPVIMETIEMDDSFLIIMEYVEGMTLLEKVRNEGAQPMETVLEWGLQLCDALSYLHQQNPPVIYRDLKPANIMLKPDGTLVLIDFDAMREWKNRPMPEDENCLGTRGYAAPEQFGGQGQTDPRTDIYCLGTTLFHLLTGYDPAQPPYTTWPIGNLLPEYAGSGPEQLILKCTAYEPDERYQNCRDVRKALKHILMKEVSGEKDGNSSGIQRKDVLKRILLTAALISAAAAFGAILSCISFFTDLW